MRTSTRILTALAVLMLSQSVFAESKRVLGILGQALSSSQIRSQPSTRARIYYRVKPYEYLVVQNFKYQQWLKVLMQNNQYGYISAASVAKLPYEVTANVGRSMPAPVASRGTGSSIANYALNFIGTPYKWGGNDETSGIDCSGFVKKMYGTIGVSLPRTAAEQAYVGQPIYRLEDLLPGDRLYFYESKRNKIGHCGIYLGQGYFVHSSSGRRGVATDFLTNSWRRILVAARR